LGKVARPQATTFHVSASTNRACRGRAGWGNPVLRVLSWLGLVWDLRTPSKKVRDANRVDRPEEPAPVLAPAREDAAAA
jgi:hypothetical protein